MKDISPPEYLAALLALEAGLKEQIGEAKRAVLARAEEVDADRFKTPYGPVTIGQREGKIEVTDEAAFLRWVKENRPDEIVEEVRASYRKSVLEDRLVVLKGEVFDKETGEPVPWAELGSPGAPYPTWTSTAAQRQAKEAARALFRERAQILAGSLRQITEEGER